MKKLFTIIVLSILSITAIANTPVPKKGDRIYVRVNWVDQIGTSAEKSAEVKSRRDLKGFYETKGFMFDKISSSVPANVCPGLYMVLIKK